MEKEKHTMMIFNTLDLEELKVLPLFKDAKVKKASVTKTAVIDDMVTYLGKEAEKLKAKIETKMEEAKSFSAGKNKDLKKAIKFAQDAVELGGGTKAENRLASYKAKLVKEEANTEAKAKAKEDAKANKEAKGKTGGKPVFHRNKQKARSIMTFR